MNTSNTENRFSHNPVYTFPDDDNSLLYSKEHAIYPIRTPKDDAVKIPEPAAGFLKEAQEAMQARAALRDTPEGERTAGKIAKVFNAITGHNITESDAWIFLIALKLVRSRSGKYCRDDYVDLAAYSGLLGEHESTLPK